MIFYQVTGTCVFCFYTKIHNIININIFISNPITLRYKINLTVIIPYTSEKGAYGAWGYKPWTHKEVCILPTV